MLLQIFTAFLSGIGFSVYFNVHGYRVWINAAGAALSWILYLIFYEASKDVFRSYFLAAVLIALLCECLARITRTPTALMIVPMIVPPLVPGGDLYNTFFSLMTGSFSEAELYGIRLVQEIAALNFGIILAATLVKLLYYINSLRKQRLVQN